ncbi:MAG: aminotransferase class IV, partial [Psychroserpens sp.]|nr:aminotransferase class IV [Psychroserpens sp.]
MVHGTHNAVEDQRNDDILIYINGEFFRRKDAKISVFDSGYLVGDGIWEAMRLHKGVLVFVEDHLNRLWDAAATIGMKIPYTKKEFKDIIQTVLD